jgi:hypothetical protein
MNRSNLSLSTMVQVLLLFCSAVVMAEQQVRPLDWSLLGDGLGSDGLATICPTVIDNSQDEMGANWLKEIAQAKRVNGYLDFWDLVQKMKAIHGKKPETL